MLNESNVYDELVIWSVTGQIQIIYETVWKQYTIEKIIV